jgi:hydroxymethylbilane synthase
MINLHTRLITLGSRPSKLACWQTDHVMELLGAAWPELQFRIVTLVTEGDQVLDRPLPEIGGKGLFTSELEGALRSGEIDLAVHSLKDLPLEETPGLCIGAISRRGDARDVMVSAQKYALDTLPFGEKVGTSSLRRSAQLLALRPDLVIAPLRGNVDTRIRKALVADYDAIILAAAGVQRLGLEDAVTGYLSLERMLPAPGQGALAVECRKDDPTLAPLLAAVHHEPTAAAVSAERAFLGALGAGCSAPVAAYAEVSLAGVEMTGLEASLDGRKIVRVRGEGRDPLELGQRLADEALAQGAAELIP